MLELAHSSSVLVTKVVGNSDTLTTALTSSLPDTKSDMTVIPDVTQCNDGSAEMQKAIEAFYTNIGFTSATTAALSNETRADLILAPPPAYQEAEKRPLRLLSLGASFL